MGGERKEGKSKSVICLGCKIRHTCFIVVEHSLPLMPMVERHLGFKIILVFIFEFMTWYFKSFKEIPTTFLSP